MTDSVEQSLRQAGERWRANQSPAPEPDRSRWVRRDSPTRRHSPTRRWMPAVAAASATVIAAGAVSAYLYNFDRGDVWDPVAAAEAAELVVDDGYPVQATGMVQIAPGQPVRFCAPAVTTMEARGGAEQAPSCVHGVPVTGVDADRLSEAKKYGDVRTGFATMSGIWRAGVLEVTRQSAPATSPAGDPRSADLSRCPAPAEGWKKGEPDEKALSEYVEEDHPDRFRAPRVTYPGAGAVPSDSGDRVMVLVVELVDGDLSQERQELTRRYAGNLCLVSAPDRPSLADQIDARERVSAPLESLMWDQSSGIYGLNLGGDVATVDMVMLTPSLYDRLTPIGFGALKLNPWLRPVQ